MTYHEKYCPRRQSGISLVEIMVAMVIGLIATLVVMQVFSVFEGQKRTTSGSADAQTNGTVALFALTQNIQRAGFGLFPAEDSAYECTNAPTIDHDNNAATAEIGLAPIELTDGGANPDTVTIHFGNSQFGGVVTTVTSAPSNMTITRKNDDGTEEDVNGSGVTVRNNMGCKTGDIAVLANGATCMLRRVTATSVKVASAADYTRILLNDTADVSSGTTISCLGAWQQATFAVDSATGNLRLNDTDFMNGIVNLQAEYGVSLSANDNTINSWEAAKDLWAKGTISVADRNRIKAIRLSVVARNQLSERSDVTDSPADYGVADTDANKKFRYRRFETIIPLRNVIWAKATFE